MPYTYYEVLSPRAPSTPRTLCGDSGPSPRSKGSLWRPQSAERAPETQRAAPGKSLKGSVASPGKSLKGIFRNPIHTPGCLVGHAHARYLTEDAGGQEAVRSTCGEEPGRMSDDMLYRNALQKRFGQCGPSTAEATILQENMVLKQQLRRIRDQQQLSAKMIERIKREAAGWREKFAALSETEKQSSVQIHTLAVKVAERDDWLRESLPHKQMLQEQTVQMRADYERQLQQLKTAMATAHGRAEEARERLEGKIAAVKTEKQREETALREALRVVKRCVASSSFVYVTCSVCFLVVLVRPKPDVVC